MKKYILKSLFVSMLCMLAASCQDTDEFAQLDSRKAQVMFSVAMDSPSVRSRANWDKDQYTPSELGNAYDNHIDLNQFVVKIEAGGKEYKLKDVFKWKVEAENEDEVSNVYKFVGEVVDSENPEEPLNFDEPLTGVKVSVFANMGTDGNMTTFTQEAENIPMWGVSTIASLELKPGTRKDVGTIYLLRAMAKIEVSISDDMVADGYSLNSVKLKKYNFKGNSLLENYSTYANTSEIDTETKNVNANDSRENLAFTPAEAGKKYIVYLPEVDNAEDEDKDKELKLMLTLQKEGEEYIETELVVKDYTDNTGLIDIVRNHWYKYVISGIVNGNPTVEYSVVPWTGVGIEVGGEKFLVLNKDVVEIYNSNIDADQLKFSSSSPITSIVLTDLYNHANNGEIVEGETDGVSAYYISKYGQKIQLGTDPGFNISDNEAVLERENVILNNISATTTANALDGSIIITSPFMADPANETLALKEESHYDTPRYLEFLVTNEQGLTATFRVIQYPPVVITNEEGFYSFRDDHVLTDDPNEKPFDLFRYEDDLHSVMTSSMYLVHRHDFTEEPRPTEEEWKKEGDVMRLVRPEDFIGEPNSDYWATPQQNRDYSWTKKAEGSYTWQAKTDNSCPGQGTNGDQWYEIRYGFFDNIVSYTNVDDGTSGTKALSGIHRPAKGELPYTDYLYRGMYQNLHGEYDITHKSYKGTGLSPYYKADVLDKDGNKVTRVFRDHYRWNAQPVFWSKFVYKYYHEAGQGASYGGKSVYKNKGQVDMYEYGPSEDGGKTWGRYIYSSNLYKFANNRMYKIKTTSTSDLYTIGYPSINEASETVNTVSNARLVSPSLMLASQLGETNYQQFLETAASKNYIIPDIKEMYKIAVRHCREYVETTFKDENGDHMWNEGEEIIEYRNWRLPTKSEIEMIIDYQSNSRAMDRVLDAQYYYCITGTADSNDIENIHNWVSSEVPGYDSQSSRGYYIRCVRDIK